MARKGKVGIEYFSHDVDMMQDKKMRILVAKHGLTGYAVYNRLLEEIYRDKGYYLQIDEDFNILFSNDNNLELNVYILILNDCIEKELFSKDLYIKYNILTSDRIQINYCAATERRKEVVFIKEFMLVDILNKYNLEKVNVNILVHNVDILELNADIGTQSKVNRKESKKKVKEKEKEKDISIVDIDFKQKIIPYKKIVDLYNNILGDLLPKVISISKNRKTKIKARYNNELDTLEKWETLFNTVEEQDFLLGTNKNNWKVTFDWLIANDNNFVKVLEKQYDNQDVTKSVSQEERRKQKMYGEFLNE